MWGVQGSSGSGPRGVKREVQSLKEVGLLGNYFANVVQKELISLLMGF